MVNAVFILLFFTPLSWAHGHYWGYSRSNYHYKTPVRRQVYYRRLYNNHPMQQLIHRTKQRVNALYYDDFPEYYQTSIKTTEAPVPKTLDNSLEELALLENEDRGLELLNEILDIGLSGADQDIEDTVPTIKPNNVVEVAQKAGKFSTLLKLATNLNLVETLQTLPQVTVFAPSDKVFNKLGTFSLSEEDLKRHLIAVKLPADSIETGPAFTLSGQIVNLSKTPEGAVQIEYNGKSVNVVQTDISASNGIIHIIDGIIA